MTRPNVRPGIAALIVGTLLAAAVAAPPETQSRVIDVADMAPASKPRLRRSLSKLVLFRVRASQQSVREVLPDPEQHGVADEFSASSIADLLSVIAREVDVEFDATTEGTQIAMRGSPEALQRADDAAEILRRIAGRPARVEVLDLLLPHGVPVPPQPDQAAIVALRRQDLRGGVRMLSMDLDPGCWRLSEAVRGARRLVDVDVEIAQDAAIADPIVRRVEEGVRVFARGAPLTDGRFLLRVLASSADLTDAPRRLALGQDELGELDLPELDAGFVSTEMLLEAGRTQSIVLSRPEGEQRVLLFRLAEPALENVGGTLRGVPIGAFSRAYPLLSLVASDLGPHAEETPLDVIASDGEFDRLSRDFAVQVIERVMESDFDEDRATGDVLGWILGGAYLLRGPAASLDRAQAAIAQLERQVFRPARLSVRIEERPVDGGPARQIGHVSAPVAQGLPTALAAYRQLAFVSDYDVEVAEKSQIADPLVGVALAGILVNAIVADTGHGAHMVTAQVRVSAIDTPQGRGFGATDVGTLEIVNEETRYADVHVRTTAARPGEVNMGPSPFNDSAVLVAVFIVE